MTDDKAHTSVELETIDKKNDREICIVGHGQLAYIWVGKRKGECFGTLWLKDFKALLKRHERKVAKKRSRKSD